jgi:hypothetical protein
MLTHIHTLFHNFPIMAKVILLPSIPLRSYLKLGIETAQVLKVRARPKCQFNQVRPQNLDLWNLASMYFFK